MTRNISISNSNGREKFSMNIKVKDKTYFNKLKTFVVSKSHEKTSHLRSLVKGCVIAP